MPCIPTVHTQHTIAPPMQVLGIPTWIPWVYFAGGPAVGLLGRRVWATLAEQQAKRVQLDQAASEDSGP